LAVLAKGNKLSETREMPYLLYIVLGASTLK